MPNASLPIPRRVTSNEALQPTALTFLRLCACGANAESRILFLSLPKRFASGLPTNCSQDELLAYIAEAAEDLASSRGYEPFCYEEAGQRVLPLFTSEDHAQEFVQAYVARRQRIIPFQILEVQGESLVAAVQAHDEVVLNPGTSDAAILRSRSKGKVG